MRYPFALATGKSIVMARKPSLADWRKARFSEKDVRTAFETIASISSGFSETFLLHGVAGPDFQWNGKDWLNNRRSESNFAIGLSPQTDDTTPCRLYLLKPSSIMPGTSRYGPRLRFRDGGLSMNDPAASGQPLRL